MRGRLGLRRLVRLAQRALEPDARLRGGRELRLRLAQPPLARRKLRAQLRGLRLGGCERAVPRRAAREQGRDTARGRAGKGEAGALGVRGDAVELGGRERARAERRPRAALDGEPRGHRLPARAARGRELGEVGLEDLLIVGAREERRGEVAEQLAQLLAHRRERAVGHVGREQGAARKREH